jgi:hypothetical protein
MGYRVRAADWQRIHRGVYAPFSGELTRDAQLWAALLRAGPGAVLSHQTAAELYGLIKQPGSPIHVTVPATANPAKCGRIPGLVVHRSRILDATRHPVLLPPRTRVEDTVLDLIESTDALRWYLRGVERRHKFPVAARQARMTAGGGSIYLDNLYEEYLVCVELDGAAAHPAGEQWSDKRRDRRNLAVEKIVTMRFGYPDLCTQEARCRTAGEVAGVLRDSGPRVGAGCGLAGCPV